MRDKIKTRQITCSLYSKAIDVVVWTDLEYNFSEKSRDRQSFSVFSAITHLQDLSPTSNSVAAVYVFRSPDFVRTQLRSALESDPCFGPAKIS
jgi:hypothetical protein